MNNKGQSLVLFILLLPIFLLIFAYIFDSALIVMENIKLKDITKKATVYLVKDEEKSKIENFILNNDENITIVTIGGNTVYLKKTINSYFGKVVGHDTYELEANYYGYIQNGDVVVQEKGK